MLIILCEIPLFPSRTQVVVTEIVGEIVLFLNISKDETEGTNLVVNIDK